MAIQLKDGTTIDLEEATGQDKAIFWLKCLIELIENDDVSADEIEGLTNVEVIALAETKAAEFMNNAGNLAQGN